MTEIKSDQSDSESKKVSMEMNPITRDMLYSDFADKCSFDPSGKLTMEIEWIADEVPIFPLNEIPIDEDGNFVYEYIGQEDIAIDGEPWLRVITKHFNIDLQYPKQEEKEMNETPTFEEACDFELEFGKHTGRTLSQIVQDDPGYVDILSSFRGRAELQFHLKVFLDNDGVRGKIDRFIFGG